MVQNEVVVDRWRVIAQWKKTSLDNKEMGNRGWLIELMTIIERMSGNIFTLSQIYAFEDYLKSKFPNNRFVKEKIRRQFQVLRDKGFIKFIKKGVYEKT